LEDYIFKDYCPILANYEVLKSKALGKLKAAFAKIEHIYEQKELHLSDQYNGNNNNMLLVLTNFDFIILQLMDVLREFYTII